MDYLVMKVKRSFKVTRSSSKTVMMSIAQSNHVLLRIKDVNLYILKQILKSQVLILGKSQLVMMFRTDTMMKLACNVQMNGKPLTLISLR
jgi:hypothetical protein